MTLTVLEVLTASVRVKGKANAVNAEDVLLMGNEIITW